MMLVYSVYYLTFMTSIKSQNWTKINLGSIIKMHFIRVSKGKTSQCEWNLDFQKYTEKVDGKVVLEEWFQTNYYYFMGSICFKTASAIYQQTPPFWECKISSHVMTSLQIACLSHHHVVSVVFTTTIFSIEKMKRDFVSRSISHLLKEVVLVDWEEEKSLMNEVYPFKIALQAAVLNYSW